MRIRSIKPEFYSSEDIAALDWNTRLVFIGLWSYVDDNGVGRDNEQLIVADLFPLETDPRETLARVHRALSQLFQLRLITRYKVDTRPFVHIVSWAKHQVIDRPSKSRYPLPTCGNAVIRDYIDEPSRDPIDIYTPGAVEQGNRGTGDLKTKTLTAHAPPVPDPSFAEFWSIYPKKVGKSAAEKAFIKASKSAPVDQILDGVKRLDGDPNLPEARFIPNPATWLNQGRWADDPYPPQAASRPNTATQRTNESMALVRRLFAEENHTAIPREIVK